MGGGAMVGVRGSEGGQEGGQAGPGRSGGDAANLRPFSHLYELNKQTSHLPPFFFLHTSPMMLPPGKFLPRENNGFYGRTMGLLFLCL